MFYSDPVEVYRGVLPRQGRLEEVKLSRWWCDTPQEHEATSPARFTRGPRSKLLKSSLSSALKRQPFLSLSMLRISSWAFAVNSPYSTNLAVAKRFIRSRAGLLKCEANRQLKLQVAVQYLVGMSIQQRV